MSEVPFIGRNPVYIATLAVFIVLQVATAKATNYETLMALRFTAGFFGSPVLATGGATLADMYTPAKRAYAISIWGIAAVCGPALGPVVGGFVTEFGPVSSGGPFDAHWTWPIWVLCWLSAFCLIFLFFLLPETSASNILFRRSQRLRRLTGNDKLLCQPEIDAMGMTPRDIALMCLVHPFTLNFTVSWPVIAYLFDDGQLLMSAYQEPMVFLLNMYLALIYGLLYIWFESFVIVFVEIHHFSLGELGLSYLGMLAGVVVVIPPYFWLVSQNKLRRGLALTV